MSELNQALSSVLADGFSANAARVRELAVPLSQEQFWNKPFSFGNSVGHLVLHLTGNLNYYVGAQIAETGYVRDRPREFTETKLPSKLEALAEFDKAVEMVKDTVRKQSAEDWSSPYFGTGVTCENRFAIVLNCAAHADHHIGQILNLARELVR